MKKYIAACFFLLSTQTIISMSFASAGKQIYRTYAIDPRCPATCLQSGESIEERDARLAAAREIAQANEGSPDLFPAKGISPHPPRSLQQIRAEQIALAATYREEEK